MSDYPAELPIETWSGAPPRAVVRVPGSKSLTNRALIVAAMADGPSVLTGALDCDDTRVMVDSLRRLGIDVEHDAPSATIRVAGCGGSIPARSASLEVANSGTSLRFLTAMLATGSGHLPPRRHARGCASGRSPTCSGRSTAWAPTRAPTSGPVARR